MVRFERQYNITVIFLCKIYIPVWFDLKYAKNKYAPTKKNNLHSSMVRFKEHKAFSCIFELLHLHSSMVRFKALWNGQTRVRYWNLHSSMVRFKEEDVINPRYIINIYIPVWFDLKQTEALNIANETLFTFQYGSI